ncbi:stage II sporulation protein P [Marinicrinis sediminis]|uniref:Stage II sporulation protein P n=1 Tax=Marinicrinis sediminis TaxID=1652465 RepID=A0ABW5R9Z8_9BACL
MKPYPSMKPSTLVMFLKLFFSLAVITTTILLFVGIGGMIQTKMVTSPISSMQGLTAEVSSKFFLDMVALEVPGMDKEEESSTFSQKNVSHFLFRFVTSINPADPKTLLAREIPGLDREQTILLRKGTNQKEIALPQDYTPSREVVTEGVPDLPNLSDPSGTQQEGERDGISTPTPPNQQEGGTTKEPAIPQKPEAQPDPAPPVKRAFIYHSHNRESWVTELEGVTDFSDAFDSETNITLVGKRLAEKLEERGVGTVHSETDYPAKETGFNYNFSYKYSKKSVQEAFVTHPDLAYFFDIHRDAQKRDLTTATIEGVDYAQVYFIIGYKNPNWKENETFANDIHERLESEYPGLSRGIYAKDGSSGHGEYNQSFSPHSLLIEVGGPENTLEESYRTADILAEVIADLYWKAESVQAVAMDTTSN